MQILLAFQLLLIPAELPTGIIHKPYDAPQFQLSGGARCARNEPTLRLTSGHLPSGLVLSSSGILTGIPREAGAFHFQVEAANGCSATFVDLTLEIHGAPILDASESNIGWLWKKGSDAPIPREFLVAGSRPGLAYRIDGAPAWLDVAVRSGTLPLLNSPFEADLVTLSPNIAALAPGKYSATLSVGAWGAVRSPKILVELEVQ
jgi:hypothetical protein